MWRVYNRGGVPNPRRPAATVPSPLRAAFDHPDLDTAELGAAALLGNGADPNAPEPGGHSALHAAAARGSLDLVEMLVRKGGAVDARDDEGRTPLDTAEFRRTSRSAG